MIAPSGACASVPTKTAVASQRPRRPRPRVRQAAMASASVVKTVTAETTRFENSTSEW